MLVTLLLFRVSLGLESFEINSGPLQISWPKTWVRSRFELDSNFVNSASIVYFYFSLEDVVEDLSGYYAGLKIPRNVTYSDCSLNRFSGDHDWKASCPCIFSSSDSNLVFGPIDFIIAESPSGQILARDSNAGFIGLWPDSELSREYTMQIELEDYTLNSNTKETVTLIMFVNLTDEIIFQNDYFVLIPKRPIFIENLNAYIELESDETYKMKTYFEYNSDQYVTAVYLFGFKEESFQFYSKYFKFEILTLQSSNLRSESLSWIIEARRYGTNALIGRCFGNGLSLNNDYYNSEVIIWFPLNQDAFESNSTILNGLSTYWNLTFKINMFIPVEGKIVVNYNGVTVNNFGVYTGTFSTAGVGGTTKLKANPMLFWSSDANVTTKVNSSTQVIVTSNTNEGIPEGSLITIVNYLTISTTKTFINGSISIYMNSSSVITGINSEFLYDIVISPDNLLTSANIWLVEAQNSINQVTDISSAGDFGMVITFTPKITLLNETVINIYMPCIAGLSALQNRIVMYPTLWGISYNDTAVAGFKSTTVSDSKSIEGIVTVHNGKITFTIMASSYQGKPVILYIGGGTKDTPRKMFTPLFPNQKPLEAIIKIKNFTNYYYGTSLLSFKSRKLNSTVDLLCKNLLVDGSPVKVNYDTIEWTTPSDTSLTTIYEFFNGTSYLNLFTIFGLNHGDSFPSTNQNLKVSSNGTLFQNSELSLSSEKVSIILPLPKLTLSSKLTVNIYIKANVKSIESSFIIFSATGTSIATTSADYSGIGSPSITEISSKVSSEVQLNITLKSAVQYDLNSDGQYLSAAYSAILILPSGFSTKDSRFFSISSLNNEFPYNVYFKDNFGTVNETATKTSLEVLAVTTWREIKVQENQKYYFAFTYADNFSNSSCTTLQASVLVNPELISVMNYSPANISNFVYNLRTTDVKIEFKTSIAVSAGSIVSITLDKWKSTQNKDWTVKAGTTILKGTISSGIWTSSETKDKISPSTTFSVIISNVPRPVAGTNSPFQGFSSINIYKSSKVYLRWINPGNETTTYPKDSFSATQGVSKATTWVYPNVLGTKDASFFLTFKTNCTIPAKSNVLIEGNFYDKISLQENLWTSHSFSLASIADGVLSFFIAKEIQKDQNFNVFLRNCLTVEKNTSDLSPVLVTVISDDFDMTVIIKDTKTNAADQKYEVKNSPELVIDSFEFYPELKTPGFPSWYSFELLVSQSFSEGFWINLEVRGSLQSIPGPAVRLQNFDYPLLNYRNKESQITICYVSQWTIHCKHNGKVKAGELITFEILLNNGLNDAWFNLYITDSNGKFLFQPHYSSIVQFDENYLTAIDLYHTQMIESGVECIIELWVKFNDNFEKIPDSIWDNLDIIFSIPESFDMKLLKTVRCSGTTDLSTESRKFLDCKVFENKIYLDFGRTTISENPDWMIVTLYNLPIPDSGFIRNSWVYESNSFDLTSKSFELYLSSTYSDIISISTGNLNAAFVSFNEKDASVSNDPYVIVNGGKFIAVYSGFKNGPFIIETENGKVEAFNLMLVASELDDENNSTHFELSDDGTYFLSYASPKVEFYISVPDYIPSGLYKIVWKIKYSDYFSCIKYEYQEPKITFIQVDQITVKLSLERNIFEFPEYYYSSPIRVYLDQDDLMITVQGDLEIYFSSENAYIYTKPNPVIINKNYNESFFFVLCGNCYNYEYYEIYSRINYGYQSYLIDNSELSFSIILNEDYDYSQNNSNFLVTIENLTHFGFDVHYEAMIGGVISWALVSSEMVEKNNITFESLNYENYYYSTPDEYTEDIINAYLYAINNFENYNEVLANLMDIATKIFIYGKSFINEGSGFIESFNCLFPNSNYQFIFAYEELSKNINYDFLEVMTNQLPSHAILTIESAEKYSCTSQETIAIALEVNLCFLSEESSKKRELKDSITLTFYANPFSKLSPKEIINLNEKSLKDIFGSEIKLSEISADDYPEPSFTKKSWDETEEFLVLEFQSSINGTIFCTVKTSNESKATIKEVYVNGFQDDGIINRKKSVFEKKVDYLNWNFTNVFDDYGYFQFSCIICNEYPGIPKCSKVISTEVTYLKFDDKNYSGLSRNLFALALAILLVI